MKTLLLMTLILSSGFVSNQTLAKVEGNSSGGGGDASEARVNEIREDLLSWINKGGAKKLDLPKGISYETYVREMKNILKPKKVVVSFTNKAVVVGEEEKTCRGFVTNKLEAKMICNIKRFAATTDAYQYTLIHHEYAGLVNLENNVAGASDYEISNQLTGFLEEKTVLKLAVKDRESNEVKIPEIKPQIIKNVTICQASCQSESIEKYGHHLAKVGVIYYAPATEDNKTSSSYCLMNAKEIAVYSNRLTNYSSNTCLNALAGKFYGKTVEINNDKDAPEEDEGTYFSIVEKK